MQARLRALNHYLLPVLPNFWLLARHLWHYTVVLPYHRLRRQRLRTYTLPQGSVSGLAVHVKCSGIAMGSVPAMARRLE